MEVNEMMKKQYFTCIGKGHGSPCLPATREDWEKLRRESWLKEMCARIERGDEQLKHRLPVWTPHCAEFRNNHRAIADAVRPLNRLMLDFDEKGHTDEIMQKLGLLQREELRVKNLLPPSQSYLLRNRCVVVLMCWLSCLMVCHPRRLRS